MKEKLKVLCIEDCASDAELIRINLEKGGLGLEFRLVQNRDAYSVALTGFLPDIILCDHSLPSFNSAEALKMLKESGLQVPFILITGTLTEETASRAMREGAEDFILKDRLQRLPYAVLNAVEKYRFEKERQALVHRTREKEEAAQKIVSNLADKLLLATKAAGLVLWEYWLDEDTIIYDNAVCELFGRSTAGFTPAIKDWIKYVHPDDGKLIYGSIEHCRATGGDFRNDFRVLLPDKTIRYVRATGSTQCNMQGKSCKIIGTMQDITKAKQEEKSLLDNEVKYRSLFENSMDAILLTAPNGEVLAANAAASGIFQMSEAEIIGRAREGLVLQDEMLERLLQERAARGYARGEVRLRRADGKVFPAEVTTSVFLDASGRKRTSMIIRDITERKKLEAAVQREKERYADLFLHAPACVGVVKGPDHVFEMANPLYLKIMGRKNVIGRTVAEVFPEAEAQGVIGRLDTVYQTGRPFSAKEMSLKVHKNGEAAATNIYLDFVYIPHKDEEGAVEAIFFFANDVTEQVMLRKKIEERERNAKQMFHSSPLPKFLVEQDSLQFVLANKTAEQHYGYTRQNFSGLTFLNLFHPGRQAKIAGIMAAAKKTEAPFRFRETQVKKNGEQLIAEINATGLLFNGRSCFLVAVNDLTEQVLLQHKMTELEVSAQKEITRAQIKGQEEERELLGKELHDNVNQQLCTAQLYLNLAKAEEEMRYELVDRSEKIIQSAIGEIRNLSKALVPPALKDIGLVASIEELVMSYTLAKKFTIHFTHTPALEGVNKELQLCFFRIIQEQLTNISKYAEAQNVWIDFAGEEKGLLRFSIKDDGKGFDTAAKRRGVGLLNIKNRIGLYNGTTEIISSPHQGCLLVMEVPLGAGQTKKTRGTGIWAGK